MSLADISLFYILGEDAHHESFVRAWMNAHGVNHRRMHAVERPVRGGGWKYVLSKCKEIVERVVQRNKGKARTRVIIVIDADESAIDERMSQLREALGSTNEANTDEIACILIPKRHIETWVHALNGSASAVNEDDNYKEKSTEEVKSAARTLAKLTASPMHPPSLAIGYEALRQLKAS